MGVYFLLFCCLRKSGVSGSGSLLRSTILRCILPVVLVVAFDVGRAVVKDIDVVRRVWFDDDGAVVVVVCVGVVVVVCVDVVLAGADVFDVAVAVDVLCDL